MIITPYTIPVAVAGASPTTVAPTTTMPLATPALVPRHYTYWNGRDIETVNAVTYTLATGFTTYPAVTCLPYSARAPSGKSNSIDAACFTVSGPYHDIPVSATFVVVDKCSTVDGITTTAYSTYYDYWDKDVITTASTVTIEPWVRCSWHLTADHPENCETVSPLGWASLIFTIFTIQVMWWASDIHLLFKPRDKGGGLRAYFDAVVWACIRATSPMSAGAIALHCGDGPAHGARIYYQGVRTSSRGHLFDGRTPNANWRPGRSFKYWISVFTECLTIATATLTMVRACSKEYANIPFSESWRSIRSKCLAKSSQQHVVKRSRKRLAKSS
ncbi:hypothetical protein VTJ04DRAFT_1308 [Mycothermus thermophilus]|uniref:uncharacterized protein n=1 Tax=Humicola insolens TaxID=85995 RepID=UPI00374243FB